MPIGPVVYTYTIRNTAGNESVGTVTVNINPINDAPASTVPHSLVFEDSTAGLR